MKLDHHSNRMENTHPGTSSLAPLRCPLFDRATTPFYQLIERFLVELLEWLLPSWVTQENLPLGQLTLIWPNKKNFKIRSIWLWVINIAMRRYSSLIGYLWSLDWAISRFHFLDRKIYFWTISFLKTKKLTIFNFDFSNLNWSIGLGHEAQAWPWLCREN